MHDLIIIIITSGIGTAIIYGLILSYENYKEKEGE